MSASLAPCSLDDSARWEVRRRRLLLLLFGLQCMALVLSDKDLLAISEGKSKKQRDGSDCGATILEAILGLM